MKFIEEQNKKHKEYMTQRKANHRTSPGRKGAGTRSKSRNASKSPFKNDVPFRTALPRLGQEFSKFVPDSQFIRENLNLVQQQMNSGLTQHPINNVNNVNPRNPINVLTTNRQTRKMLRNNLND